MKNENNNLEVLRHSMSHVMAAAVKSLYPDVKFAIGPSIENGFYYDFDFGKEKISEEDLRQIEKKMKHIIKQNVKFEEKRLPIGEAISWAEASNNKNARPYKLELIRDLKKEGEKKVSFYKLGDFEDLCRGPHVESTNKLNKDSFKLTSIAGAYWKGSEKNQMLTRIYATAFETKKELDEYLVMVEEALKRDHRKLGKELDLFCFSDLVGPGLPLFTPKGTAIKRTLERWIEDEERRRGYVQTCTPDIARVALYKKSGHWDHYKEDMYPAMEIYDDEYVLRPMTCPHQFMIYNSRPRSYRELPLRYSEISRLYRREKSGELFGLIRHAGGWSFADAHIVCLPEQTENEFEKVVDLIQYVMKTLEITEYWYRFSKWDPENKKGKYVDDPKSWDASQKSMKKILDKLKLEYVEAEDEAAFYGPKLDVQLQNINGKDETAFTVQIDFALPEKFNMTYIDKDGKEKRPVVIHRGSIGCLERTMAFLIEKYAGAFPVWLSPVQVKLISVGEGHVEYCKKFAEELLMEHDIRVEVDDSDETVSNKTRKAVNEKIPYMLVVGDKEMKSEKFSIRDRGSRDTRELGKEEFIQEVLDKIKNKN